LAYVKPTGKKKLQADLAQQKVRVTQAQEKLNRRINGVPIIESDPKAYELANTAFEAAIAERDRLQKLIDDFKEPEKKLSKFEADKKRQEDLKAGIVPPPGSTVSGDPNTNQTGQVENFDSLIKSAKTFLRKEMSDDDRLILATQLANAGYEVPKIKAYNDSLLSAYTSLIQGAKSRNKEFPDDIKTVDDFLAEQTNIANQIKAAGGGEDERYKPFGQQEIFNKSTAEGVIENLYKSITGKDATGSEVNSLYKELLAEQKKASSISKGTYKMVGGRRVLVQESGLDPRVFLENRIKELPAYKESQAAKSEKIKIDLASTALANGYNLEVDFANELPNWLDAINSGKSIDEFKNKIRVNARRILPEAVRNQIDPDEDLSTTFSTYMSNIAKAKGVPVNTIRVQDVIPLAITDKGFADSQQFEVKKRSQAWWDSSPEGISVTTTFLNDTLKDFGMLGQGVRTV
jgi:DNA repair exonuclease SbcCD ATPase subunit